MADAVWRGHMPQLPDRILNAPDLEPGLTMYWRAYSELMTDRPAAFGGVLPIPWSSCARWAGFHKLDEEQFDDLVYFVRQLDDAFLAWHKRKYPEKGKTVGGT